MVTKTLQGSDEIMEALGKIASDMAGGAVSVGFMEGATYPDGTPVAAVAFWNEYGHGGRFPAPPRPFFRTMINKESPTWPKKMASLAKATNYNGAQVLGLMGQDIQDALKQSINELTAPPLSSTTLMLRKMFGNKPENITFSDVLDAQNRVAKGEDGATGTQAKPLIWTSHMLNSITFKVES